MSADFNSFERGKVHPAYGRTDFASMENGIPIMMMFCVDEMKPLDLQSPRNLRRDLTY